MSSGACLGWGPRHRGCLEAWCRASRDQIRAGIDFLLESPLKRVGAMAAGHFRERMRFPSDAYRGGES